jgi:hypothetical protein
MVLTGLIRTSIIAIMTSQTPDKMTEASGSLKDGEMGTAYVLK